VKRFVTALLIAPIRLYQRLVSPALGQRCRYYPTCSDYAVQAIQELGPVRGTILAGYRLLRCTPFHHGGIDEIADRRLFRNAKTRSDRHAAPAPRSAAPAKIAPASSTKQANLT
jgi:uncharacterized protein